jgi:orotidine-5'-phosphate decarboxylase
MNSPLRRIAVALDTADRATFRDWARFYGPRVGMLKIGLEAFSCFGPEAIDEARGWNPRIFLDLKLHDIPQTVASSVAALRRRGVSYLTVHASGGAAMLTAATQAAQGEPGILAVTLLTHIDEMTLVDLDLPGDASSRVVRWARIAEAAGCVGAVCSPRELGALRASVARSFQLVTPGIRQTEALDDQRRVASAEQALREGADWLVIGRPLTQAADRERALAELEQKLREAEPA